MPPPRGSAGLPPVPTQALHDMVCAAQNVMAWLVAGGLAYYLWVVPERQRNEEQQRVREQARRWAEEAAAKAKEQQ